MLWMFSFSGRINRLQYFLGGVGLGMGLFVVLAITAMLGLAMHGLGGMALAGLIWLGLGVAGVWSNLALRARRIRDIGWPVAPVLGGMIVLTTLNIALSASEAMSAFRAAQAGLAPPPVSGIGAMSSIVGLALDLCLLFWPGKGPDEDGLWRAPPELDPVANRPAPAKPRWTDDLLPAGPRPAPVTATAPTPATGGFPSPRVQTGFGRRGL